LLQMCKDMDQDGTGDLTYEEIVEGFDKNEAFRDVLSEMDIGEEDLAVLWTILDSDKSGNVSSEEFVSHCYRMKLSDTQFMLAYIKYYITVIKDKICDDMARMEKAMLANEDKIASEQKKMEAQMAKNEEELKNQLEEEAAKMNVEINNAQAEIEQVEGMTQQIGATSLKVLEEVKGMAATVNSNKEALSAMTTTGTNAASTTQVKGGLAAAVTSADQILQLAQLQVDGNSASEEAALNRSILEGLSQQQKDVIASINEIKDRLSVRLPDTGLVEPKLSNDLPRPMGVPNERWPLSCCQSRQPVTTVVLPNQGESSNLPT